MIYTDKECVLVNLKDAYANTLTGEKCRLSKMIVNDVIELIQQPTLPLEPTDELLRIIGGAWCRTFYECSDTTNESIWNSMSSSQKTATRNVYNALRAALTTPPAPKEPRNIIVLVRKPNGDAWDVHTKDRFNKDDLFTKSEAEQYAKAFPFGWKIKLVEE